MKKRTQSKNFKILSATAVAIFTMLASFSGSFAWFQARRTAAASSDQFEVINQGESISRISFHAYAGPKTKPATETTPSISYYSFNPSPAGEFVYEDGALKPTDEENPFVLNMNDYTLETPHQPILILIYLTDSGNSYISANNSSVYPTTNNSLKGAGQGNNPLSSIVEFYTFTYSSDTQDPTHISNRIYDDTLVLPTSECNKNDRKSFAQFNNKGDYAGFSSEVVLYNGSTEGLNLIGIVVDYNSDSLEWISSFYLGDERLEGKLSFKCDWWMNIC